MVFDRSIYRSVAFWLNEFYNCWNIYRRYSCKNTEVILCQANWSQQCIKNEIKSNYGKKECSTQTPRSNFSIYLFIYLLVCVICKYSMPSLFLYFTCIFKLHLCMYLAIFFSFFLFFSVLLTPHPAARPRVFVTTVFPLYYFITSWFWFVFLDSRTSVCQAITLNNL